jgi:hypothetical protein
MGTAIGGIFYNMPHFSLILYYLGCDHHMLVTMTGGGHVANNKGIKKSVANYKMLRLIRLTYLGRDPLGSGTILFFLFFLLLIFSFSKSNIIFGKKICRDFFKI